MAKRPNPVHATLYDFRDAEIMHRLAETNGSGVDSHELAEMLGFEAEEGARAVGMRMAWMRKYGMVAWNESERHWSLSQAGRRVVEAKLKAPEFKLVEKMPDEKMVEMMALVTSRYQRGETMIAHMLRREFAYGTQKR